MCIQTQRTECLSMQISELLIYGRGHYLIDYLRVGLSMNHAIMQKIVRLIVAWADDPRLKVRRVYINDHTDHAVSRNRWI